MESLEKSSSSSSSTLGDSNEKAVQVVEPEPAPISAAAASKKKTAYKKTTSTPVLVARKKITEKDTSSASASASATKLGRRSCDSDKESKNLPHYISVYKRKLLARKRKVRLYLDIKSTMSKYMKVENNFVSEFGYNMLLDRRLEPLRKWNAVFRKFMSENALGDVASSLTKTAK